MGLARHTCTLAMVHMQRRQLSVAHLSHADLPRSITRHLEGLNEGVRLCAKTRPSTLHTSEEACKSSNPMTAGMRDIGGGLQCSVPTHPKREGGQCHDARF